MTSRMPALPAHDHELDVSNLICPLPVLKAQKRLKTMKIGEILKITATDPAAAIDFPHYCNESGHALLATETDNDTLLFIIRKTHD